MSDEDRARWDHKWGQMAGEIFTPHLLLTSNKELFGGGVAVDLACGRGQNTIWLADYGYRVIGLDISRVALAAARTEAIKRGIGNQVLFAQMDLGTWSLPDNVFDLICVFRYLERALFAGIQRGLKVGGLLIYATRHLGVLKSQPHANKTYLLRSGELLDEFGHWQVIHYAETSENAQIIARKR